MSDAGDSDTYALRAADLPEIAAPQVAYKPPMPQHLKPRIGVIGTGGISGIHLDAYRKAGWTVGAMWNRTRAKAEEKAAEYCPAAQIEDDWRAILTNPDIDVVDITLHPEHRTEIIEAAVRADDCGLVILDSLAGLVPKAELDGSYLDQQVATQARLIAKLSRRLNPLLVNEYRRGHHVAVVFLNQMRTIIGGSNYGPSETCPGGWAAKHFYRCSIRIGQLKGDVKKGELDAAANMKNALRFSASSPGSPGELGSSVFCATAVLMHRPLDMGTVQRESRDVHVEILSLLGLHVIAADHDARRCR